MKREKNSFYFKNIDLIKYSSNDREIKKFAKEVERGCEIKIINDNITIKAIKTE